MSVIKNIPQNNQKIMILYYDVFGKTRVTVKMAVTVQRSRAMKAPWKRNGGKSCKAATTHQRRSSNVLLNNHQTMLSSSEPSPLTKDNNICQPAPEDERTSGSRRDWPRGSALHNPGYIWMQHINKRVVAMLVSRLCSDRTCVADSSVPHVTRCGWRRGTAPSEHVYHLIDLRQTQMLAHIGPACVQVFKIVLAQTRTHTHKGITI